MSTKPETRCFLVSKDVVVPLTSGAPVVLGRDPTTCNFVLSDERVSRVHAMVLHRESDFFIKDLNSSNGTLINSRKVTSSTRLHAGDIISIPPFKFEFVRPDYANAPAAIDSEALNGLGTKNRIEGSLSAVPLPDLIQLLNATRQSGVLSIDDKESVRASLIFDDGEIVQAQYGAHQGENAVYALVRNRQGRFEFTKTERFPLDRPPQIQADKGLNAGAFGQRINRKTQSLLLEGARLMDENRPDTQKVERVHANATAAGSESAKLTGVAAK